MTVTVTMSVSVSIFVRGTRKLVLHRGASNDGAGKMAFDCMSTYEHTRHTGIVKSTAARAQLIVHVSDTSTCECSTRRSVKN